MPEVSRYRKTGRPPIDRLQAESEREGFGMLTRLAQDWQSEDNRFDGPGEAFFVARMRDEIVAVGGLNIDPYTTDNTVGRVRHVYVSPGVRRRGVGRLLVLKIIDVAIDQFEKLRLRTDTEEADRFYRALGFQRCNNESNSTHYTTLKPEE